ncbi:hypothetical protein F090043F1_44370 [Parabacteroides goldsteinii]|jgi:hypothetical protein|nr:hypothetical protein CE91St1_22500 [Parabacteroides goldsteinii]GKG79042.1 hypothetical protein CE91St2_22340 [Parabacteroides goldsteinii]
MLYQAVGMSFSSNKNFLVLIILYVVYIINHFGLSGLQLGSKVTNNISFFKLNKQKYIPLRLQTRQIDNKRQR